MIKSMTGYGRSGLVIEEVSITVELRSVNHKYQDIVIRLPKELYQIEDDIKRRIQGLIKRGRVDCTIVLNQLESNNFNVQVDWEKAYSYYESAKKIKENFQFSDSISLDFMLKIPDLFKTNQIENTEKYYNEVLSNVSKACSDLVHMRKNEGSLLHKNLVDRIASIELLTDQIHHFASNVLDHYRVRLMKRIEEFLAGRSELDEGRIMNEVAIFADKSNIDEELSRLASHNKQFIHIMNQDEPVGRKLDFLIQEMNREINTIGAKANDIQIAQIVIEIKSEIEKLREQVQNIE